MNHLEKGLHAHFAQLQNAQAGGSAPNGTAPSSASQPSATESSIADAGSLGTPFARVNTVEPGSPAAEAGLKTGDLIRAFGGVHWLNHERLSKVAEAVQQNEGVCYAFLLVPNDPGSTKEKRKTQKKHKKGGEKY